jgi:hypothetical protein
VFDGVMLARFFGVMRRVQMMTVRDVRVMTRFLMIACLMMLRRFAVMMRGVFMVFGGMVMMFRALVFCHSLAPCALKCGKTSLL